MSVVREHPGPATAVAGASGYLVGYVQLGVDATNLGVPQSSFALDFREYVILALGNILWLAWLAGVFLLGRLIGGRLASGTEDEYFALAWAAGPPALVALLTFLAVGSSAARVLQAVEISTVGSILLGLVVGYGVRRTRRSLTVVAALMMVLATSLAVVLPTVFIAETATTVRTGEAVATGTSLDLVIRPLPLVLLHDPEDGQADGDRRVEVVVVSNRGGQAAYVHERTVVTSPSADLVFIAPPVGDPDEATRSPSPETE